MFRRLIVGDNQPRRRVVLLHAPFAFIFISSNQRRSSTMIRGSVLFCLAGKFIRAKIKSKPRYLGFVYWRHARWRHGMESSLEYKTDMTYITKHQSVLERAGCGSGLISVLLCDSKKVWCGEMSGHLRQTGRGTLPRTHLNERPLLGSLKLRI